MLDRFRMEFVVAWSQDPNKRHWHGFRDWLQPHRVCRGRLPRLPRLLWPEWPVGSDTNCCGLSGSWAVIELEERFKAGKRQP